MSTGQICRLALDWGLLVCTGKTPEATMASSLYGDIKRKDRKSLFVRPQEGLFGLREWLDGGAPIPAMRQTQRSTKRRRRSDDLEESSEVDFPKNEDKVGTEMEQQAHIGSVSITQHSRRRDPECIPSIPPPILREPPHIPSPAMIPHLHVPDNGSTSPDLYLALLSPPIQQTAPLVSIFSPGTLPADFSSPVAPFTWHSDWKSAVSYKIRDPPQQRDEAQTTPEKSHVHNDKQVQSVDMEPTPKLVEKIQEIEAKVAGVENRWGSLHPYTGKAQILMYHACHHHALARFYSEKGKESLQKAYDIMAFNGGVQAKVEVGQELGRVLATKGGAASGR